MGMARGTTVRRMAGSRRVAGMLAFLTAVLLAALPVAAVEPDEILADPKLEARARALSLELRCLVCQNQSIDDSNAPLARDLRLLVRERLKAGDSDADVMRFVVARYGDFVLLRPPFNWKTLILWLSAPAILIGVGLALWRRMPASDPAGARSPMSKPLTREEETAFERIMARGEDGDGSPPSSAER